jgi:hypothetical protein
LGTRDLLGFPVDAEGRDVVTLALLGLPADIRSDRSHKRHAVRRPARDEQIGVDVAGIHQMLLGQQGLFCERLLDGGGAVHVARGRQGGVHVGDEVGLIGVARFRDVDFVARPRCAALGGIVGLRIIGGVRAQSRRWEVAGFPPADPAVIQPILGDPRPPHDLHGRNLAQVGRRSGVVHGGHEREAVSPDLFGEVLTFGFALG